MGEARTMDGPAGSRGRVWVGIVLLGGMMGLAGLVGSGWKADDGRLERTVHAANAAVGGIQVAYPMEGSIFPPEIDAPTVIWKDGAGSERWEIELRFADGGTMRFATDGPTPPLDGVDARCVSANNRPPELPAQFAGGHSWKPDAKTWEQVKKRSMAGPAEMMIRGYRRTEPGQVMGEGRVRFQTSRDPVGAPIFYRDVPLMPSATEKGVIKPLAQVAIPLINWRLKTLGETGSRVVMHDLHTCANCHSFSADGKTMGLDMDGPQNDKGLYAVLRVKPQMEVTSREMTNWNPTETRQFAQNRVGFMSQVSPDGRYVLTMLTSRERGTENNYYVTNFTDYRFLQVFYPTRGVLWVLDRQTGERKPLPGADDAAMVQTNGVWSPDGKWVVFARARAKDPYPAGGVMAKYANDPNEVQIQYDLYRVPFNGGRGGTAEAIRGASGNGKSNSFPKVSPDGRWIVFVEAQNGEVMRPDGQLYIVPFEGGEARRLDANMGPMNSWHSWSPNGRWLVFSSKARGPYTRMYLTHMDEQGNSSPAIYVEGVAAGNRAVNLPEFVNIRPGGMEEIRTPAIAMYKEFDEAAELAEKGEYEQARTEWERLARENPGEARIHNNYGVSLMHLGRAEEAVGEFETALKLNPEYGLVHGNLASALEKAGRSKDALSEYSVAVEATPDAAELHNRYGMALRAGGEGARALAEFARAVRLKDDFAEAHDNLGLALAEAGERGRAEEEFRRALELDGKLADAANNLGMVLAEGGDDRQAVEYFERALEIEPEFAKAMVNLAAEMAGMGKMGKAQGLVERALKLEPENREARELERMLQKGGGL